MLKSLNLLSDGVILRLPFPHIGPLRGFGSFAYIGITAQRGDAVATVMKGMAGSNWSGLATDLAEIDGQWVRHLLKLFPGTAI